MEISHHNNLNVSVLFDPKMHGGPTGSLFVFFLPTRLFSYLISIYKTTTSFVISPFFPLDVFHWWLYVVELFFTFVLITPIVLLVFKKNLKRCIRDYCMPLVIKLCVIPIFLYSFVQLCHETR